MTLRETWTRAGWATAGSGTATLQLECGGAKIKRVEPGATALR